jgi:hypothetical protein
MKEEMLSERTRPTVDFFGGLDKLLLYVVKGLAETTSRMDKLNSPIPACTLPRSLLSQVRFEQP